MQCRHLIIICALGFPQQLGSASHYRLSASHRKYAPWAGAGGGGATMGQLWIHILEILPLYNPLSPLLGGVLGAGLLGVLRVGLGAVDLLDLVRRREHHLVEINVLRHPLLPPLGLERLVELLHLPLVVLLTLAHGHQPPAPLLREPLLRVGDQLQHGVGGHVLLLVVQVHGHGEEVHQAPPHGEHLARHVEQILEALPHAVHARGRDVGRFLVVLDLILLPLFLHGLHPLPHVQGPPRLAPPRAHPVRRVAQDRIHHVAQRPVEREHVRVRAQQRDGLRQVVVLEVGEDVEDLPCLLAALDLPHHRGPEDAHVDVHAERVRAEVRGGDDDAPGADEGVVDEGALPGHGHVGHNERHLRLHGGGPQEAPLLEVVLAHRPPVREGDLPHHVVAGRRYVGQPLPALLHNPRHPDHQLRVLHADRALDLEKFLDRVDHLELLARGHGPPETLHPDFEGHGLRLAVGVGERAGLLHGLPTLLPRGALPPHLKHPLDEEGPRADELGSLHGGQLDVPKGRVLVAAPGEAPRYLILEPKHLCEGLQLGAAELAVSVKEPYHIPGRHGDGAPADRLLAALRML
mmetsp:Transcript_13212/g.41785  ORF Transcript_13212/g.41785 Transcript_13212/m.41785 type:complete len:576 (+) Transcript_13212:1454-3181(+)